MVADVLVHEMIHATVMLRGEAPATTVSPGAGCSPSSRTGVLGHEVTARPVLPRRVPNPERETGPAAPKTIVVRQPEPSTLARAALATWPHAVRRRRRDGPVGRRGPGVSFGGVVFIG